MSTVRSALAVLACTFALSASVVVAQDDEHQRGPCKADREKLCKDVQPGQGAIARCLKEHESELSEACKAAMQRRGGRGHRRDGADAGT